MATWAVGDVHGCWRTLRALLEQMSLDPGDRFWMVGDLINRGPGSLEVLRWAIDQDDRLTTVIGNHDLHLLAVAVGATHLRKRDTLTSILEAPDRDDLLEWVRTRPLMVREDDRVLVHAGLRPEWDLAEAEAAARRGEDLLRGPEMRETVDRLRNRTPGSAAGVRDLDFLTRVRMLDGEGRPDYAFTGPPESAPAGLRPWYEAPDRRHRGPRVIFGHWAALGFRRGPDWLALDSGCVWGGQLTAVRLEDGRVYQQRSLDPAP